METIIQNIIDFLVNTVENSNYFVSIIMGMSIIILESMIPILPLALFIAINILVFGNVVGFFLSWIATTIGCSISFHFFRFMRGKVQAKIEQKPAVQKIMDKVSGMQFHKLVILLAIPFTPAFSVNIAAGLSNMRYSKYLSALLISKIFLVYFWGYIGTTFIESITDIGVLFKLGTMLAIAFVLSKLVMRKFDIE